MAKPHVWPRPYVWEWNDEFHIPNGRLRLRPFWFYLRLRPFRLSVSRHPSFEWMGWRGDKYVKSDPLP